MRRRGRVPRRFRVWDLSGGEGAELPRLLAIAVLFIGACSESHRFDGDSGASPACVYMPPPSVFTCDAEGFNACLMWTGDLAATPSALSRCTLIPGPLARCASADRCEGRTCTCGREPECGEGAACLLLPTGPSCVMCSER